MKPEYLKQYFSSPDVKARQRERMKDWRKTQKTAKRKMTPDERSWILNHLPMGMTAPYQDSVIIRGLRKKYRLQKDVA